MFLGRFMSCIYDLKKTLMFSVYANNFVSNKWYLSKCFIRQHVRLMS